MLAIPCILLMAVAVVALLVWDGRRARRELELQWVADWWGDAAEYIQSLNATVDTLRNTASWFPVDFARCMARVYAPRPETEEAKLQRLHDYLHSDEIARAYD